MTIEEFDREFDVIYENINKGGAPGLISYEKSVILTQAAETLARQLVTIDLSLIDNLVSTYLDSSPINSAPYPIERLDKRSVVFKIPTDFIKILNETIEDNLNNDYVVAPLLSAEYSLFMSKPYKFPRRRTAWRLENSDSTLGYIEIIGRPGIVIDKYIARIVKLPEPIILEVLTGGFSIRGETAVSVGNLNPSLHPEVLKLSVGLAEQYYYDKYGNDGSKDN